MTLVKELKVQSIVVLAQSFNPSVFNRHWLIKNNFIEEESVLPNSIFVPGVTQLSTKKFNLVVVPEQLQFNIGHQSVNLDDEIKNTLLPIIEKLQEIPYKAVGLNFNWFVNDSEKSIKELCQELFFISESKLFQKFETENSRFGSYMSMDFGKSRLKLDIKPVNSLEIKTKESSEYIQFAFNFHIVLKLDDSAKELIDTLKQWSNFKNESKKIIDLL